EEVYRATAIDPWFLRQIEELVAIEAKLRAEGLPQGPRELVRLKQRGFSDARLAALVGHEEEAIAAARRAHGVLPAFKRIDTCGGEFPALTPYMYSAYEGDGFSPP